MWSLFVLACALTVCLLFLPGFLILKSLTRMRWFDALACAPFVGVAYYAVVAILYWKLGIRASFVTIYFPLLLVSLTCCAARLAFGFGRRSGPKRSLMSESLLGSFKSDLGIVAAYLIVGVLVAGFVFVKNLDGADSVFQAFDNGAHLNAIATFLSSGNYSSFIGDFYADSNAVSPYVSEVVSFYPRAWHELVALVVSGTGPSIPLAINAVNTVLLGVVYPLGMNCLLRRFLGDNRAHLFIGAVACQAFPAGLIDFVAFGPLYPMLLSYALAPAVIACFVDLSALKAPASDRIRKGVLFVVGCLAVVLSQPSGIFLMAVVLAPYCVVQTHRIVSSKWGGGRAPLASVFLAVLLIAAVWFGCYTSPFFESVVEFNWPAQDTIAQAVMDVVLFSTRIHSAQPVMSLLVLLGIFSAFRGRGRRWLIAPYLLTGLTYVVCVAFEGDLKHILGGFWYTDPHRLGANVAFAAVPLAVLGTSLLYKMVRTVFSELHRKFSECPDGRAVASITMGVLCASIFYPSFELRGFFEVDTAFGYLGGEIEEQNDLETVHVLDSDEMSFVQDALRVIPEGSLIINSPNDGSGFIYALYGANTYYRNFTILSGSAETDESMAIRNSLNDISTDEGVRDAVESIGAQYVLLLDQGAAEEIEEGSSYSESYQSEDSGRAFFWSYYPELWEGIENITDTTAGFEMVLSEGDMRLYKITSTDSSE